MKASKKFLLSVTATALISLTDPCEAGKGAEAAAGQDQDPARALRGLHAPGGAVAAASGGDQAPEAVSAATADPQKTEEEQAILQAGALRSEILTRIGGAAGKQPEGEKKPGGKKQKCTYTQEVSELLDNCSPAQLKNIRAVLYVDTLWRKKDSRPALEELLKFSPEALAAFAPHAGEILKDVDVYKRVEALEEVKTYSGAQMEQLVTLTPFLSNILKITQPVDHVRILRVLRDYPSEQLAAAGEILKDIAVHMRVEALAELKAYSGAQMQELVTLAPFLKNVFTIAPTVAHTGILGVLRDYTSEQLKALAPYAMAILYSMELGTSQGGVEMQKDCSTDQREDTLGAEALRALKGLPTDHLEALAAYLKKILDHASGASHIEALRALKRLPTERVEALALHAEEIFKNIPPLRHDEVLGRLVECSPAQLEVVAPQVSKIPGDGFVESLKAAVVAAAKAAGVEEGAAEITDEARAAAQERAASQAREVVERTNAHIAGVQKKAADEKAAVAKAVRDVFQSALTNTIQTRLGAAEKVERTFVQAARDAQARVAQARAVGEKAEVAVRAIIEKVIADRVGDQIAAAEANATAQTRAENAESADQEETSAGKVAVAKAVKKIGVAAKIYASDSAVVARAIEERAFAALARLGREDRSAQEIAEEAAEAAVFSERVFAIVQEICKRGLGAERVAIKEAASAAAAGAAAADDDDDDLP